MEFKRIGGLFLIFIGVINWSIGQNNATPLAGAKGAAMGNASVGFSGIESVWSNQAGLASINKWVVNLTAENRFLSSELNQYYLATAYATPSGVFALSAKYFGFDAYNEQKIGLAYARKLFENLSIGVQFDYLNTRIKEYGNNSWISFELGLQSQIFSNLTLGAHVFNPVKIEITENENLPTILRIGFTYKASNKINLVAEIEKDINFPFRFKGGIEYQLADPFFLRFGVGTNPVLVSFGVGYRINNIQFDAASSYHQFLGFSPVASFNFQSDKK